MTTSDTFTGATQRRLRRSDSDRVGAGVAGGLGTYFDVDPVLFRVLFATSAFFGGAGLLAYLLAWAVIPDETTAHAPVDRWVGELRRRRVPVWAVVTGGGVLLWIVAFSWWAPGPFVPVLVIGVLLIVLLGGRGMRSADGSPPPAAAPGPVSGSAPGSAPGSQDLVPAERPAELVRLDKPVTPSTTTVPLAPADPATGSWVGEVRAWVDESRAAGRARRRRSLPVRLATLGVLVAALTVLGLVDAASGVQLQFYFWTALAIVVLGLLTGTVLRRFPPSLMPLLVPAVAGLLAFAGSHTSLTDGIGTARWTPTTGAHADYRLAFGQAVLDLRQLPVSATRTIDVTMGAGQLRIIAPRSLRLTVLANVRAGQVTLAGAERGRREDGGVGLSRTLAPPSTASGAPLAVDVHLAEGQIVLDRR